jgi:hypothetical protein
MDVKGKNEMVEVVLIIKQLWSLISRLSVSSFHDTKNFNGCIEKQKTATGSVRMPTSVDTAGVYICKCVARF